MYPPEESPSPAPPARQADDAGADAGADAKPVAGPPIPPAEARKVRPMRRRSRSLRGEPRAPAYEMPAAVAAAAASSTSLVAVPTAAAVAIAHSPKRRGLRHLALPAVGLAVVIATAAYVRYVGITQVGLNSDEAVYSGQAAAIAGFQPYGQLFGVFRAHPLLVQFSVALGYAITGHVSDWLPRTITASFGIALVVICWGIGNVVRGRFLGFAMGMIAALCPYAVIVSRQMLLDGPMTTFVAATMLALALWLRSRRVVWFYAAAAIAALAVLSKEMGILTIPAVVLFVLFSRDLPLRWRRDFPIAGAVFLVAISPYPLSLFLGGGAHTTNNFIVWQFFRQPNHDPSFYLSVIPNLGYLTVTLAVLGLISLHWRWQPYDTLALTLILWNIAFFQIWPTKGFEYLMPVVPAVIYLAGRGAIALGEIGPALAERLRVERLDWRWAASFALAMTLVSIAPSAARQAVEPVQAGSSNAVATDSDLTPGDQGTRTFIAGTGGLAASRPTGQWIRDHTLPSARFLTIGPSFANVIQFYGQRKAVALSVSPNPLHRNPQYEPVINPDAQIRSGSLQYLVFDSYSASRSAFFTKKLLAYVNKFGGVAVFSFREDGASQSADVVIYEVHP